MRKSQIFFLFGLSFILGVVLGSFTAQKEFILIFILGLLILMVKKWQIPIRIIILAIIFLFLGFWRYQMSLPKKDESKLQFYNGQEVIFIGVIREEPDLRQDHLKLIVRAERLFLNQNELEIQGKVLIKTSLYPEYQYGDRLKVKCTLEEPGVFIFKNENGEEKNFNYDQYLARFDVYSLCLRPEIKLIGSDYGNPLISRLLWLKKKFITMINQILPEPQSSFLGGLLLGARRGIPKDLLEFFNLTGTSHIVAVSGYNITIIAVALAKFFQSFYIPRKQSFWLISLGILFFVIICGAQASVVRSGIMGILVLLASYSGRLSRMNNILVLAAVVMLLINPKILVFDRGFELSFLATIGLVYLSPPLERYLVKIPSVFGLKETFIATLSAIILTTPLILYYFGRFSLIAPLANILILPFIPLTMASGFLALILGLINVTLGQIAAWVVWVFLSYIIFIVKTLSKFKYASFSGIQFSWWMIMLIYFLLGMFIWHKRKIKS